MLGGGVAANGRYGVPIGGLSAWADADPSTPAVAHLDAGLEVQLVERRGDWGRVVCSNGWSGWIDARMLVSQAPPTLPPLAPMGPPPGPPAMAPTVGPPPAIAPTVGPPLAMAPTLGPAMPPPSMDPPTMSAYAAPPTLSPPTAPPPPYTPPETAVAAPPTRRSRMGPPWASRGGRVIIAVVLLAAVVVVSMLLGGGKANAGEVFLKPADSPGADTFSPSIANPPTKGPAATTAPAPSSSGLVRANAAAPGLYAGTRGAPSCNGESLTTYLEGNPSRGRAWAGAQGIQQGQIRPFIATLTPASLRVDTRITDYQFSGGRAVPKQSILQGGTAVLLDRDAIPRVRCQSGDPLGPPRAVSDTPSYSGPRWSGFAPATTVVLDPAPGTTIIVLVDPRTGLPFARVLGSVIVIDLDRPATGVTIVVVEPGGPFTVTGARFPPGAAVQVLWDNPALTLATPTADGGGNFAISVNAPPNAAIGPHQVTITGGGVSVVQTVYVIPPRPR